jgi:16S rRNA (uracil1498-N3)-methyltransferase
MSSRRFLLTSPPKDNKASVHGEEAYHLSRVLRAKPGMKVELMDGFGKVWSAVIEQINPELVELGMVMLLHGDETSEVRIDLILALCKTDKLEWILEKTTEIGVANIYLLNAERSVAKLPADRLHGRIDRWQKIMNAASKQSRRLTLPRLHLPAIAETLLPHRNTELKLMLSERSETPPLKTLLRERTWESATLGIGPEGGWTTREEKLFSEAGFRIANMGRNILRSETAAIVATAILRYELGDR